MATYTEPSRPFQFLLSEGEGEISRESITVASGAGVLLPGTVLGKVTASGKYVAYDNDAADGSQTAVAILCYGIDATSADVTTSAIVRLAEVSKANLAWGAAVTTQGEKDAAYVDFASAFVIARA